MRQKNVFNSVDANEPRAKSSFFLFPKHLPWNLGIQNWQLDLDRMTGSQLYYFLTSMPNPCHEETPKAFWWQRRCQMRWQTRIDLILSFMFCFCYLSRTKRPWGEWGQRFWEKTRVSFIPLYRSDVMPGRGNLSLSMVGVILWNALAARSWCEKPKLPVFRRSTCKSLIALYNSQNGNWKLGEKCLIKWQTVLMEGIKQ